MDNRQPVNRILGINTGVICIGLLFQYILWRVGENSPLMHFYAGLMVGLLILCVLCWWYASHNPDRALLVYAWGGFAIIAVMVVIDAVFYPDTLPGLMYAPVAGVVAIGALVGYKEMVWYMLANLLFVLGVGLHYGMVREIGPPMFVCVIMASTAVIISAKFDFLLTELTKLKGELTKIQQAIGLFSDVKSKRGKRD